MATGIVTPVSYPPRTSVGSVSDILARQLEGGGLPPSTIEQLRALESQGMVGGGLPNMTGVAGVPQNLAVSSARMNALQSQLGGPLTDTSGLGMTGLGGPSMAAIEAPLQHLPGIPVTPGGTVLTGAGMNQPTLALNAGSATTQAGAVNAARAAASNPSLAAELNGDVAALRGPAAAATDGGGAGLLAQLRGSIAGSALPEGSPLAFAAGAGPMGIAKTLGARLGVGTAAAIAPTLMGMGVEAFGKPIEHALGLAPGSTKGTAQAGADVGTGALLGTLVAPGPGTLIGAALGGLKDVVPLAGELVGDITGSGVAQQWGTATGQFNKIITKPSQSSIGKKGVRYLNENYYPAGQEIMRKATAGEITHEAAVQGMQKLNSMMQADITKLRDAHSSSKSKSNNRTAVQIQMGDAMAKLAADSRTQGAAAQATLNNLAMDPNMAGIAPIIQASGAMRNQWGNNMADAFTGAAYGDIPQKALDAKIARLNQLEQQIQAQQSASSGGGGSSLADLAAKVK